MGQKSQKPKKETAAGFFRELLYAFIAVLIINSFVLASFEVPTGSMEDTVKTGDFLFVNKFIYGGSTPYTIPLTSIRIPHFRVPGFRSVKRGDVIVFDWPGPRDWANKPPQMWYLKRCIALPGDVIRIENKAVYVNDKIFPNPPHSKFDSNDPEPPGSGDMRIFPPGANFNKDNYGPIIVPKKGMTLVLNAHTFPAWETFIRREGHSAELNGDQINIDGRMNSNYVVQRDYVFAMGDNRDNSLDSRFWGFVPLEDVIGTPMIVYWSWNPQTPLYQIVDKISSIKLGRIGTIIR